MKGCLNTIGTFLFFCLLFAFFTPAKKSQNEPKIPEIPQTPAITQEQYNNANKWLLKYYKDYYNAPNWSVKDTKYKNGKIVVNLRVADEYSAYNIPLNKTQEAYFVASVCPNNKEDIYKIVKPEQIEVELFDYSGMSSPPDLIGFGNCYIALKELKN